MDRQRMIDSLLKFAHWRGQPAVEFMMLWHAIRGSLSGHEAIGMLIVAVHQLYEMEFQMKKAGAPDVVDNNEPRPTPLELVNRIVDHYEGTCGCESHEGGYLEYWGKRAEEKPLPVFLDTLKGAPN